MSRGLRQYSVLLWKNCLQVKDNLFWTLMEAGLPGIISMLLVAVVRPTSHIVEYNSTTTWNPFPIVDRLPLFLKPQECNGTRTRRFTLAYVPNNTVMDDIMNDVTKRLRLDVKREALGFATEGDMERYLRELDSCQRTHVLAALVMTSPFPNGHLAESMSYKLRPLSEIRVGRFAVTSLVDWATMVSFPDIGVVGPRNKRRTAAGLPGYYSQGFLTLQRAIDFSLMTYHNDTLRASLDGVSIRLQRHPYPPYTEDAFINVLGYQLPLLIVLSFFLSLPNFAKELGLEKERRHREFLKLNGVCTVYADMAFFTRYFIIYTSASALITLFLYIPTRNGGMINHTAPTVLFVLLVLYFLALMAFAFFVSTFFNTGVGGALGVGALHLLTYAPFFYIQFHMRRIPSSVRIGTSIFPNLAAAYACYYMAVMEGRGIGVQWYNIHLPLTPETNHTILHTFLFLILDIVMFSILSWYFDNVLPRKHGVSRPFYFLFTEQFWCKSAQRKKYKEANITYTNDLFEDFDKDLKAGIQIRDLRKVFSDKNRPVLSGVNLDAFCGQITALLGRNGSGKTTLISMTSGFKRPSSGRIYLNGYLLSEDLENARSSLGLCPQQEILFDMMTVREHLVFYAKIKGFRDSLTDKVEWYIKTLHLASKRDVQARHLSLAQRRKLSIAIAFITDSECVLLDAPTDGMDPVSQEHVWELLRQKKGNRSILLCTQSMDEATALADRVAILDKGAIRCFGTPSFLKQKFCDGYNISIITKPACERSTLVKSIKSKTPVAQLQIISGRQVSFSFRRSAFRELVELLRYLEDNLSDLAIVNIKAGTSTLGDVFKKITQDNFFHHSEANMRNNDIFRATRIKGHRLCLSRIKALFLRNVANTTSKLALFLIHIVLVITFVAASCAMSIPRPEPIRLPSYALTVDHFNDPIAPYLVRDGTHPDDIVWRLGQKYSLVLETETGVRHKPLVNDEPWFSNDTTMDDYLAMAAEQDLDGYLRDQMTAATFSADPGTVLTGHFNNEAIHTPAIALNLITNTLAKLLLGDIYSIRASNHPLPRLDPDGDPVDPGPLEALVVAFCTLFGFVFLTSSFVLPLVDMRKSGSKHMDRLSGVTPVVYWLSTFLWDYVILMVCGVFTVGIMLAFRMDAYVTGEAIGALFTAFLLYGWAAIPLNYLMAFLFDIPSSAYVWITSFNNATSTVVIIAITILSSPSLGMTSTARIIEWTFYGVFPHYALQNIIVDLATNYRNRKHCTAILPAVNMSRTELCESLQRFRSVCCPDTCQDYCAPYEESVFGFHFPGIGRGLTLLSIQGLFFFAMIAIIESNAIYRIRQKGNPLPRSSSGGATESAITTNNLTKQYKTINAINNLTVSVARGEMLALVGVNGAGKSTVLKLLTGEETLSGGDAFIGPYHVTKDKNRFLGYCPQSWRHTDGISVREMLVMYSRLRGVPSSDIDRNVNKILGSTDLITQAEEQIAYLSDGNKKKLHLAIAFVGHLPVVLLDDPTTGLDPVAKSSIWDTLAGACTDQRAIVTTGRSLDESMLYANRAAVLVNGCLKRVDDVDCLSRDYGDGYTLVAKIGSPTTDPLPDKTKLFRKFIKAAISDAAFKFRQRQKNGLVVCKLKCQMRFFDVLEKIEANRNKCHIVDYSLSFVSLEEAFLREFSAPERKGVEDRMSTDTNGRSLTEGGLVNILDRCPIYDVIKVRDDIESQTENTYL